MEYQKNSSGTDEMTASDLLALAFIASRKGEDNAAEANICEGEKLGDISATIFP